MHRHQKFIMAHGVLVGSLPQSVQDSIKAFKELEGELDDSSDPDEAAKIRADIDQADRELMDEIEELIDNELDEELSDSEIKNQLIHALVVAGKSRVTWKELKGLGYPMEVLATYKQERVGDVLVKLTSKFDSSYDLIWK